MFTNIVLWHSGPPFNYTPKSPGPENTFDGHFVIGYTNDNANQVAAQLAFMQRLNIDGIVGNPPGPLPANVTGQKATDANVNDAMRLWKNAADSSPTTFLFSIMADHEMWDGNSQCNGSGSHANFDPVCVEKIMICNLDFMNTATSSSFTCALDGLSDSGGGYFGDSRYWKISGHPVLSYFMDEASYFGGRCTSSTPCPVYNDNQPGVTCTSSAQCWDFIFRGINHHISSVSFGVRPFVIYRDNDNFDKHAQFGPSDGAFRWFNPSTDQTFNDIGTGPNDACGYACWLDHAFSLNPSVALGVGLGKVDHSQSPFEIGDHIIMDAKCGKTWLTYLSEPGRHGFSTSHQLQALEIATWDDYDEGTEMETGIDNCVSSLTESISGRTLSWSISFNSPGDESTIDHYTIFYSTDGSTGQNLTSVANVAVNPANNGNYSFTLPTLPSPTVLHVKAVGKSMLRNHMTAQPGVLCTVCGAPTPGTDTVTITGWQQYACCNPDGSLFADTGQIGIVINGGNEILPYPNGDAPGFLAQYLRNQINAQDPYVTASWNGDMYNAVLTLTARTPGSNTNYSLSAFSTTYDPTDFPNGSFTLTASGPTLTGGHD